MQQVEFAEIRCSALGFGCASVMGRVGRRDSLRAMHKAWDEGITLFDTARSYGYGEAEGLLGEFLAGRRGDATVVTKFGILPRAQPRWKTALKPAVRTALNLMPQARTMVRRIVGKDLSAGHFDVSAMRSSLEESLRQLRTDYVDVLLMHLPFEGFTTLSDLMEELEAVVREGKARRVGISTVPWMLARVPPVLTAVQMPVSLLGLSEARAALPECSGRLLMTNQPFGGNRVGQMMEMLSAIATDKTLPATLREKLRGDPRERLAELVFGAIQKEIAPQAIVASMLRLEDLRANIAAMGSTRFTAADIRLVRQHVQHSVRSR